MPEATFEKIVRFTQEKLGDGKAPSLSVVDWIKSAILNWAHSASISSFAPFDAQMSRDRAFDDLLIGLFDTLLVDHQFDGINSKLLVCSALADALELLRDENRSWASERCKENDVDFAEASLLSATTLAVFRTLQHFDSERAMRWADNLLQSEEISNGFLSFGTQPFAIALYATVAQKHAKSEARSGFFTALYEWAERNTTNPQVIARFPELLLTRLEAVYGSRIDEQQFDVLCSVFTKRSVENLQPIQAIDKSVIDEVEDFDDAEILGEFASKLSDIASVHVSRHIREMPDLEKRKWLESETLRETFWGALNSPPIPEYNNTTERTEFEDGSALKAIFGRQANA